MQFSSLLSIQAQMTLKHAQAELKNKQAEMKKMDSGYKKDQDTLQAVKSTREKLQAELNKINYEGTLSPQLPISLFTCALTFLVCLQMVRRRVCWTKEENCQERLQSLKRNMSVWCPTSPTCALTTSKSLPTRLAQIFKRVVSLLQFRYFTDWR